MKTQTLRPPRNLRCAALALIAMLCALITPVMAQSTAGGTVISNTATASYSDGTNSYSATSNTVTVTVANVAGLTITPDGGSVPTVVAGQTSVDFTFTVTNSGNFATQVRFPAAGAGIVTSGPVTVTQAVIDVTGNGLGAGDVDRLGNGSAVLYPSASPYLARNASFNVVVRATVNAAANAGDSISVTLGDASGDNVASNGSAAEVRTSVPSGVTLVGSESEAVGSITTSVENDAKLQVELTVPSGPVALGSNITYSTTLRNNGARPVAAQTLQNAPAGSNTGVFVVVPIPQNTVLQSVPAPPAGVTVLYSTSALGADPGPGDPPASGPLSNAVAWTTTAPGVISSTTRVAFRVNSGNPVTNGAVISGLDIVLTVQIGINATNPIWGIAEAFGRNSIGTMITDRSDNSTGQVANKGDGNANFNEPKFGVDPLSATKGFQLPTTLTQVGSVLVGPSGAPAAVGPTNNNDDYTNKSVAPAAIAGLSHLDTLSGAASVDFTNTVQNTGNANDTFTFTAPTVPAGFTVAISTNGGTSFITLSGGGSTTLAVAFGSSANVIVRVTAPTGTAVLQGFSTTIRATSGITAGQSNDTIDRLYTGFLKLVKTYTVINGTGVGAATDPVPGADIQYTITYSNVSVGGGGAGCVDLVASNVVISENGASAPNNWAATTTQVLSPAPSDSNGGTITDGTTNGAVTATTTFLKDAAGTVNPGVSKAFVFRRRIN
ncbi:MAG: beta strand repeat-containing protein [Pyrinomonadaceae bacterium]